MEPCPECGNPTEAASCYRFCPSCDWDDHDTGEDDDDDERQPDEEPCGCHRWGAYQCLACRRYDARDYEDPAIPTNDND